LHACPNPSKVRAEEGICRAGARISCASASHLRVIGGVVRMTGHGSAQIDRLQRWTQQNPHDLREIHAVCVASNAILFEPPRMPPLNSFQ